MIDETLFALISTGVAGGIGAFDETVGFGFGLAVALGTFAAVVLGGVWLGGSGNSDSDEALETKERTEAAFRTFSEIVDAFLARRAAADNDGSNAASGSDSVASANVDASEPKAVADETGANLDPNPDSDSGSVFDASDSTETPSRPTASPNVDDSSSERGSRPVRRPRGNGSAVNNVDFWREDYWNYDFDLDGSGNAFDDANDGENGDSTDDSSNADGASGGENGKSERGSSRPSDDARTEYERKREAENEGARDARYDRKPTANYFGAFFKNRGAAATGKGASDDKTEKTGESGKTGKEGGAVDDANGATVDGTPNDSTGETKRAPRWKRPNRNERDERNERNDRNGGDSGADGTTRNAPPFDSTVRNDSDSAFGSPFDGPGLVDEDEDAFRESSRLGETNDARGADDANGSKGGKRSDGDFAPDSTDDSDFDDDADGAVGDREFDFWNENASWDDGPNEEFLDDETKSDAEKIDYLRRRIADRTADGLEVADETRAELARLLVRVAAESGRDEKEKALAALDEAERIAEELTTGGEESPDEFLGRVLLQRPLYYLRNGYPPPIETANSALARIRAWAEGSLDVDARRLLATAWQTRGNCLAVVGGEAAALSSLRRAEEMFAELVDEGNADVEPSLAYAAASIGETYLSIGDLPKSIESFRKAVETLDKYSSVEPFLAEKVNVLFRLSVATRRAGDFDAAEKALQEAVDVEESLMSIDEEDYVAPFAQLSDEQADFYVQRERYQDAFVAIDQGVVALKRYLACDLALSSRVRGYVLLENLLRKRATVDLCLERVPAAIRDLGEALEYLALAAKKGENFNPTPQLVATSGLLYGCAASRDDWEFVSESQEALERLVERATPEERDALAPIYGQLLLQRHMTLCKENRFDEAEAATEESIRLLSRKVDDEDGGEYGVLLAKSLFQRASFTGEVRGDWESAKADFARAEALFREAREENGPLDDAAESFFLEILNRKALAELRTGANDDARRDLAAAIRGAISRLNRKRWSFFNALAAASRGSVVWARAARDEGFVFRVVSLWLRFFRRLRRFYLDARLDDAERDSDSATFEMLENVEAAIVDLRRARIETLESVEWSPEYERYFSFEQKCPRGTKTASKGGASDGLAVGDAGDEAADGTETSSDAESADSFAGGRAFLDALRRTLEKRLRTSEEARETGNVERNATETVESDSAAVPILTGLDRARFVKERTRFATETLADDPKTRAIFDDLQACARAVERRVGAGNFELTEVLYRLLDKSTDVYLDKDETRLAAAETIETARIFDSTEGAEGLPDSVWSTSYSFWELQATLTSRLPEAKRPGVERDETEKAFRRAFDCARRAAESSEIPISAAGKLRLGGACALYLAWTASCGRPEEGLETARREGAKLEERADLEDAFDRLALGAFYYNLGRAATDADLRDEAKKALTRAQEELSAEKALVGERPEIWEREGNALRALGRLALLGGEFDEARSRFQEAFDAYWRYLATGRFDSDVFLAFAGLATTFLRNAFFERGKVASRRTSTLIDLAKNWEPGERARTADPLWRTTLDAATFRGAVENCSVGARRLFDEADSARASEFANAIFFEGELSETKRREAFVWLRLGFWESARKATREAVDAFDKVSRFVAEETKAKDEIELAAARAASASTLAVEGRVDEAARIVDELEPTIAAAVEKAFARRRRRAKDGERDSDAFEVATKTFAARFESMRCRAEIAARAGNREAVLAIYRELGGIVRRAATRGVDFSKTYWCNRAEVLSKFGERREAIIAATRALDAPDFDDEDESAESNCRSLLIRAGARIARNRRGDLAEAERDVESAFEKLRAFLRAGRFDLRAAFIDGLAIRARLELRKGNRDEAAAFARRARRLAETSLRRGQTQWAGWLRRELEPLERELAPTGSETRNEEID